MALTQLFGPLLLFWMMFVVGLELEIDDFRRVARYPMAVILATLAQWTLLPIGAGLLVRATGAEPHIAAGVVLLTASPGGGSSNVFTYLARANTALSVTLTGLSSLGAVFALPLVTAAGFEWVVGDYAEISVPVVPMIGQLAVFVLLPIGLGMRVRVKRPGFTERYASVLRRTVLAAMVVVILAAFGSDRSGLVDEVFRYAPLGALWTLMAMALGLGLGWLLRPDGADRFTFLLEFSVKNVGLTAIVALAGFDRPEFAVFAGSYILVGYPLAGLAVWAYRRHGTPADVAA